MSEPSELEVQVKTLRHEADDVVSVELVPYERDALPSFTAGSHIDVHLPNGLVRSYSLSNPQSETHRYVIGIYRDPNSRGGSKYVHEMLRVGKLLRISAPRNNFPLAESAARSVFIAGGIGITPFCSMLERLNALRKPWLLYYCVRTRRAAGFIDRLQALAAAGLGQVICNFDGEPGGQMLDIAKVVAAEGPAAHFYCCGPTGMLNAFKSSTANCAHDHVHLEYFSNVAPPATQGGFNVVLRRTGKTLFVPEGNTILDVLLAEGIEVPYSCQQGICGACETVVLDGVPDHRDLILTPDQHASNKVILICCSGSKTAEIALDL